ncbi:MAG: HAMP domain-containing histidine kinase [Alphaproteobacteria bacterium]|nr:HAMP domain-containing histidine kinase [Alphaproteobacteria bacterium]
MKAPLRRKLILLLLGILTAVFTVLAASALILLQRHQENIAQRSYDESGLAALQARLHFDALLQQLALVEGGLPGASLDDVVVQYDILFERLEALPTRPFYDKLLDRETLAIRDKAFAALKDEVDNIDRAAEGETEALAGMRARLSTLNRDMERLAHKPVQVASELRTRTNDDLDAIAKWFAVVIGGFIVSGAAFAVIVFRQYWQAEARNQELETLTADLKKARDQAEAASSSKSKFLSHMSHELRTPMNAILGFGQLLEYSELDEQQSVAVTQILNSGRTLTHLIDQILELNEIMTGGVRVTVETVMPSIIVDDVMAMLATLAEGRVVSVSAADDFDRKLTMVTDRNRLRQVLLNLVNNAIKYNRPDGLVTIGAVRVADDTVRFSVRDTGEGIPLERQYEVFEPFNRLGRENMSIEGTGIGLTITRELVDKLGGSIDFVSTPGQGTVFHVDLPVKFTP